MLMNILSIGSQGGWTVAIVGYSIVFIALVLLVIVFVNLPKLLHLNLRKKLVREGRSDSETDDLSIEGGVNAAIAMALHMHFNQNHDDESNIITIKKVTKNYSPWSSKIYGVMNQPR
ncbi:OadG family protein [Labilibaculum sp. K2S]|uniref:OadG family protein n=1 Tax=Labilibaculum sp. K2S TaxID=3056386 RepID=UPI0025A37967|nr:OadG family protein [Labilibaculum sp. K2S]MDM8160031.1 OadG family protein [Labilibaculum sp. K2S]